MKSRKNDQARADKARKAREAAKEVEKKRDDDSSASTDSSTESTYHSDGSISTYEDFHDSISDNYTPSSTD